MKKYSKSLFSLALILAATPVFSDGPGWTANSTVTKLVVTGNGGINIRLSPELAGCTSYAGYGPKYATLYPDHPGFNIIQSNLLAAYMADKQVALYLGDNTCKVAEMELGGR